MFVGEFLICPQVPFSAPVPLEGSVIQRIPQLFHGCKAKEEITQSFYFLQK